MSFTSCSTRAPAEKEDANSHEQDQQRIAQLTHQHRERARAMAAQSVGPHLGQLHPRLLVREAGGGALHAPQDILFRQRRRRR